MLKLCTQNESFKHFKSLEISSAILFYLSKQTLIYFHSWWNTLFDSCVCVTSSYISLNVPPSPFTYIISCVLSTFFNHYVVQCTYFLLKFQKKSYSLVVCKFFAEHRIFYFLLSQNSSIPLFTIYFFLYVYCTSFIHLSPYLPLSLSSLFLCISAWKKDWLNGSQLIFLQPMPAAEASLHGLMDAGA